MLFFRALRSLRRSWRLWRTSCTMPRPPSRRRRRRWRLSPSAKNTSRRRTTTSRSESASWRRRCGTCGRARRTWPARARECCGRSCRKWKEKGIVRAGKLRDESQNCRWERGIDSLWMLEMRCYIENSWRGDICIKSLIIKVSQILRDESQNCRWEQGIDSLWVLLTLYFTGRDYYEEFHIHFILLFMLSVLSAYRPVIDTARIDEKNLQDIYSYAN